MVVVIRGGVRKTLPLATGRSVCLIPGFRIANSSLDLACAALCFETRATVKSSESLEQKIGLTSDLKWRVFQEWSDRRRPRWNQTDLGCKLASARRFINASHHFLNFGTQLTLRDVSAPVKIIGSEERSEGSR